MSARFLKQSIVYVCSECNRVWRYGQWVKVKPEDFEKMMLASHKLEIRACEDCEEYPLGVC